MDNVRQDRILYLPEPKLTKMIIICSYKILRCIAKEYNIIEQITELASVAHIPKVNKYYCELENLAMEIYASDRWPSDLLHIEDIILPSEERGDKQDEDYRQNPKHYVYAQRPSTSSN